MLNKKQYFLDATGLISIGLLCLGYILYYSTFAECHVQFSFLNFPIFVGEIILFLCLILFCSKGRIHMVFNKCYWPVIAYFIFVLVKAFLGYLKFGPLAFRNAALFYYPFFAVLGRSFYRRDFFEQRKIFLLSLLIIGIFLVQRFNTYWTLTLFFLALILIKSYQQKGIKCILFTGLLFATPYLSFIRIARMMMVGNLVAGMYIIFSFYKALDLEKTVKRIMLVLVFFSIIFGTIKFGDMNAMKSIVSFHKMMEIFNFYNQRIVRVLKEGNYKPVRINKIGLYNSNIFKKIENIREEEDKVVRSLQERVKEDVKRKRVEVAKNLQEWKVRVNPKEKKDAFKEKQNFFGEKQGKIVEGLDVNSEISHPLGVGRSTQRAVIKSSDRKKIEYLNQANVKDNFSQRNWEGACINAVFRLFIWRDMVVEFWKEKPILGFDFGKPLRSRSLEIIGWGETEWGRDGWIGAHNSYLDMIYRAGIVGVAFIVSVLTILFKMIKTFIRLKSVTGILLCGIIINWFVAANFLLIFELPYTAIPIWTIYGMTFAYYQNLKRTTPEVAYETKK